VEVVANRRDVEVFKEVSRTIGRLLSVRALVDLLRFLLSGILSVVRSDGLFVWHAVLSDGEIWIAHGGVNPCGLFVRWGVV
jgi:hypothetical protein